MQTTKEMTISDYEAIKCDTLLKYGCPKDELWLTECQSIKSFANYYEWSTVYDLTNNHNYKGCVYYHESGSIGAFAGFSNMQEFEDGCKFVAEYLK